MSLLLTEKKNNGHIHKVDHRQCEHDPASHVGYTYQHFCEAADRFPGADHQRCIAQVEQVVPHQ